MASLFFMSETDNAKLKSYVYQVTEIRELWRSFIHI